MVLLTLSAVIDERSPSSSSKSIGKTGESLHLFPAVMKYSWYMFSCTVFLITEIQPVNSGYSPQVGSGLVIRAPLPYDDETGERSTGPVPSFSLHIHSDAGSDDSGDEATSTARGGRRLSGPTLVRPPAAVEVELAEATARFDQQLQVKARRRVSGLQRSLQRIEAEERAAAVQLAQLREREAQELSSVDAQLAAQRSKGREQLLSTLRIAHAAEADKAAQQVAELEAAARREAEEQRQKEEEAQKRAEAKAKAEKEVQEAKVAATKAEEAAKAKKEQEAAKSAAVGLAPPSAASLGGGTRHGILSIDPHAAELHKRCAQRLAAAQEAVRPFVEDKAMKDAKRSIDKFVTLNVQQISATLEQVRQKAEALAGFVARHKDAQRTYALLTLAGKLLSQCEVQITRLHSFAFPLAEVATAVAAAHPDFIDLLLARMHAACPLATPRYYGFSAGGNELEYLKLMKYKITKEDDAPGKPPKVVKESTDEYVGRMQGYVMLYAAMTQSDNPANPHGLEHGWSYLARLLNALPPNRITAAALDAFLKVAGYKLARVYRGQFAKLLGVVERDFLSRLAEQGDPDARAVGTRLQTFLQLKRYLEPPEGRNMPRYDTSSYERA